MMGGRLWAGACGIDVCRKLRARRETRAFLAARVHLSRASRLSLRLAWARLALIVRMRLSRAQRGFAGGRFVLLRLVRFLQRRCAKHRRMCTISLFARKADGVFEKGWAAARRSVSSLSARQATSRALSDKKPRVPPSQRRRDATEQKGQNKMDRLDVKIVSKLQEDATSTNSAIARTVEVSEETVRRRLKRLLTDEMIKVVAVPDARKLGYESQVLIGFQVDADKIDAVADSLCDMSEITWISVTTGSYDIFAWATLKSIDALSKFLRDDVGQIEGVRKMETFISLSVEKEEYGLNMDSVAV